MRSGVKRPKTSARVFDPTSDTLDAIAAELTRHVATQAIIEAMTPNANEPFFFAAVSIAAHCTSKRSPMLAQFVDVDRASG